MSLLDFKPTPLPKLGGLFTFLKPVDVPTGYSPNLQNVRFRPRAVLTRPGLTSRLNKGTAITGLTQYIDNNRNKTLLLLDASGNLDYQDPTTLNDTPLMANVANPGAMLFAKAMFGRIFLSFYNSDLSPAGPVRYWNGVRSTAVPATPLPNITVADSATAGAWAAGTYPITVFFLTADGGIVQGSATVNWVTAGGKQLSVTNIPIAAKTLNVVARWVCVAQPAVPALPYRFPTMFIGDNVTTSATYDSPGANFLQVGAPMDTVIAGTVTAPPLGHLAPDGPGAAPVAADSTNVGSVAVGPHMVWIVFETIFGYLTQPSPSVTWTAAGGKKALISSIPIGPWYVTARRVLLSSSSGADMFYLSTFRIPDNVTQSVELDFTDTTLLQGSNVNYLTKNVPMAPAMGVAQYGGRMVTWGGINNIRVAGLNLGFDGGFSQSTGAPLGWSLDATYGTGGIREVFAAYAGDAWRMTGNGAALNRGMVLNSQLGAQLSISTPYSLSFRARADAGPGSLNVELFSPTLGSLGLVTIASGVLSTTWAEYTGQLTLGLATIPADLVLRVYAGNTPANNQRLWIDHLLIYQTLKKFESSVLRVSNPFDPETFDGTNGFQTIAQDNGEAITAAVQLRAFLYVLKERSMHVTWDDSINPASLWVTRQIDSTIGCGSPRALVSSDTFLSWSFRAGAYMFVGSRPQKMSQEIQTTWRTIQWANSGLTHTLLDPENKLIFFFIPLNTATVNNALVLDYSEGLGQEDDPGPRKWGLDIYPNPINASLRYETTAVDHVGTANEQVLYFGSTKVYEHTGTNDDGVAIDSFYETAYLKTGDDGAGQDLFGGTSFYYEGSGTLLCSLIGLDDVNIQVLKTTLLSNNPAKQGELYAEQETERARLRFEVNGLDSTFTIKSITIYSKKWATQRPN